MTVPPKIRRFGPALIVNLVLAAVTVWIGFKVVDLADRLHGAERDNITLAQQGRTLSQQVRELGGTPRVTISPGPVGKTGPTGAPGGTGKPGKPGKSGPSGNPGDPGTPGAAGSPGAVGPSGPVGPMGPDGPAGKDGQDGKDGKDGETGPQGPAGPPPSSWTYTDALGGTHTCTPVSDGSTEYTCSP